MTEKSYGVVALNGVWIAAPVVSSIYCSINLNTSIGIISFPISKVRVYPAPEVGQRYTFDSTQYTLATFTEASATLVNRLRRDQVSVSLVYLLTEGKLIRETPVYLVHKSGVEKATWLPDGMIQRVGKAPRTWNTADLFTSEVDAYAELRRRLVDQRVNLANQISRIDTNYLKGN